MVYRELSRGCLTPKGLELGALSPAPFNCPGETGQLGICAGGRPCPGRALVLASLGSESLLWGMGHAPNVVHQGQCHSLLL